MINLQVKMSHELGNFDQVPDFSDLTELSQQLRDVLKEMQTSNTYFEQNQQQSQEIADSSKSYNRFLLFSSLLTIIFAAGIGFF